MKIYKKINPKARVLKNNQVLKTKILHYILWKIDFSELDFCDNYESILFFIKNNNHYAFKYDEKMYERLKKIYNLFYGLWEIPSMKDINKSIKRRNKYFSKKHPLTTIIIYNNNWGK